MGEAEDCIRKTYAKITYIPPAVLHDAADCKKIKVTKSPEIWFNPELPGRYKDPILGVEFVCAVPTVEGAGGIILLLQITAYVVWELGFHTVDGTYITELHRVRFSIPMLFKLAGPRMALMVISPWYVKLVNYIDLIKKAVRKLQEVEGLLKTVTSNLNLGFCSGIPVKSLKEALKEVEDTLNSWILEASRDPDLPILANRMEHKRNGDAMFPRSRFAGIA